MTTQARHEVAASQLCTFMLGGELFGIDVLRVQEVLRCQETTRVPLAAEAVRGLMNLRGQIVTAVDLRSRLGLAPRDEDSAPMNVVLRTDEGAVSLLVDEIGDVLEVDEQHLERPPDTLAPAFRELIRGVYKLNKKLLLLLDTERSLRTVQADGR
jgi:purine-binding chemotaxis protein CheW